MLYVLYNLPRVGLLGFASLRIDKTRQQDEAERALTLETSYGRASYHFNETVAMIMLILVFLCPPSFCFSGGPYSRRLKVRRVRQLWQGAQKETVCNGSVRRAATAGKGRSCATEAGPSLRNGAEGLFASSAASEPALRRKSDASHVMQ